MFKYFITFSLLLYSSQIFATWLCQETASEREGNIFRSCGVATEKTEGAARIKAAQNAKKEFQMLCEDSVDCQGRPVTTKPLRSSCEKLDSGYYKCYRGIEYNILRPGSSSAETYAGISSSGNYFFVGLLYATVIPVDELKHFYSKPEKFYTQGGIELSFERNFRDNFWHEINFKHIYYKARIYHFSYYSGTNVRLESTAQPKMNVSNLSYKFKIFYHDFYLAPECGLGMISVKNGAASLPENIIFGDTTLRGISAGLSIGYKYKRPKSWGFYVDINTSRYLTFFSTNIYSPAFMSTISLGVGKGF